MSRLSFRARVTMLVVVVAVVTAAATTWLTVWQASEQVAESAPLAQQDVAGIVDEITVAALVDGNWDNAGKLVSAAAGRAGQRVRLTTVEGELLADSDRSAGPAPARQTMTVQTRPAPKVTSPAPSDAAELIYYYRKGREQAACLRQLGIEVKTWITPEGLNGFKRADGSDHGGPCTTGLGEASPPELTPQDLAITDPCDPISTACLNNAVAAALTELTPPPALLQFGTVGQQQTRIRPMPMLVAAGLVALIVLAVSLLITRRVLRPIGALATAARRVGDGDLSDRVTANGRDELARLAEAFNDMAASLQRSREQQHDMIADIAHELRTPLTNVRGYIEALEDGVLPLSRELFRSLQEEVALQQRLVADLQELALAESGSLVYHPSRTDLADLLVACRTAHASIANAAGVRLEVDASPLEVTVDQGRLRQVVGNLITNAVRATQPGGVVTLRCRAEAGFAVIEVADTGHGIAPEHLPHVFDRFWRADTARSRDTGGRGLGLAISRELVTAQGGSIEAASVVGQGTVFTVRLPL
jgi:two-component system, OmpR family, sensor histidine kinase BaeS